LTLRAVRKGKCEAPRRDGATRGASATPAAPANLPAGGWMSLIWISGLLFSGHVWRLVPRIEVAAVKPDAACQIVCGGDAIDAPVR